MYIQLVKIIDHGQTYSSLTKMKEKYGKLYEPYVFYTWKEYMLVEIVDVNNNNDTYILTNGQYYTSINKRGCTLTKKIKITL